jgi:hypothetical protein
MSHTSAPALGAPRELVFCGGGGGVGKASAPDTQCWYVLTPQLGLVMTLVTTYKSPTMLHTSIQLHWAASLASAPTKLAAQLGTAVSSSEQLSTVFWWLVAVSP